MATHSFEWARIFIACDLEKVVNNFLIECPSRNSQKYERADSSDRSLFLMKGRNFNFSSRGKVFDGEKSRRSGESDHISSSSPGNIT